jgi:hypothetical protein
MGNQMFQYAAAKSAAQRHGRPLVIDKTLLITEKLRSYGLHVFRLTAAEAERTTVQEAIFRIACSSRPAFHWFAPGLRRVLGMRLLAESTPYRLDPVLRSLPTDKTICIQGYWECPGHFADSEELIRQEFTFATPADATNSALLEQIASSNSVCLHLRRGDRVGTELIVSPAYYANAIELVASRVSAPHFFVFADDIWWAKENLRLPYKTTFVNVNGANAAQDLRLMEACKHDIIANSTFAWWGAWLNRNREKIVVAPKYWMCRPDTYYPDLFPPGWICLDNLA